MQKFGLVHIKINNHLFVLTNEQTEKCEFIKNICTDTMVKEPITIDEISIIGFEHVYKLLNNKEYKYPVQYKEVLDYLGVNYSTKNLYDKFKQKCSIMACTRIIDVESSIYEYEECPPVDTFCVYHQCHKENCNNHCMNYEVPYGPKQYRKYCCEHRCSNNDCNNLKHGLGNYCAEHTPINDWIGYGEPQASIAMGNWSEVNTPNYLGLGQNNCMNIQRINQIDIGNVFHIENGIHKN